MCTCGRHQPQLQPPPCSFPCRAHPRGAEVGRGKPPLTSRDVRGFHLCSCGEQAEQLGPFWELLGLGAGGDRREEKGTGEGKRGQEEKEGTGEDRREQEEGTGLWMEGWRKPLSLCLKALMSTHLGEGGRKVTNSKQPGLPRLDPDSRNKKPRTCKCL